ncbi:Hsp20 family protein [Varunaivibrio sulfuroxidans]|uniref:Molecular chaperone IbpA n=1 Tax=Varunaivibrio sulfuroxidans TaxID=1773489 RepID=A0A4R3JD93_9PROT|nr:Hsp20 family protein [Varunaivibrio sulfuroxidans]TCS63123.1 molecular chaperone IbpA [Varunaivibrio sulfuroxidans]WES31807.1 Hsp20 family protein [Varunaivibrio sulfuroxidans]
MRTIDLSPLHRFAVGFDHMQRQLDTLSRLDETTQSYPPYNIEARSENDYRISLAVAGFDAGDLDVTVKESTLVVSGRQDHPEAEVKYLHRGIAGRTFERRFELADHIKVVAADLANGLLHIDLKREVPEEMKPRKIEITAKPGGNVQKSIENKAA